MNESAIQIYQGRRVSLEAPAPLRAALSGLILLLVFVWLKAGGLSCVAQESNSIATTNQMIQAQLMDSQEDLNNGEDLAGTNQVAESDQGTPPPASGPDGRTRRLQRQKSRRDRSSYTQPSSAVSMDSPNSSTALDYSAFRLITERNIFDPNRMPHAAARPQSKVLESLTLVGTMAYAKGDFAFFDGNASEYKKVLKPADTIAGYKIESILPNSVKLVAETNHIDLAVGNQLRRQEDGNWTQVASAAASAAAPASESSSSTDSVPTGPDTDIIKRLMQRREKENAQ